MFAPRSKEELDKNEKVITLLQLAQKAGKLICGFDSVSRSMHKGNIKLIILSKDLSLHTRKRIVSLNQTLNIPIAIWGEKRLSLAFIHKETGIIAVTDTNFKNGLLKHI